MRPEDIDEFEKYIEEQRAANAGVEEKKGEVAESTASRIGLQPRGHQSPEY